MEKTRKIKTVSLVALIVAVLGLTVAFAAMSRTLTINGTANVEAAQWDVRYTGISDALIEGSAEELSKPTISSDGTKIEGINVSLKKPGDIIGYLFTIKNNGTIAAKVNKAFINGIEWNEENANQFGEVAKRMYPKCDWDGDGETTDSERDFCVDNIFLTSSFVANGGFGPNYVINPGATIGKLTADDDISDDLFIVVEYDSTSDTLPKGDVEISIDFGCYFVQK